MIFVTGGTGMVGAHLLVELTKNHDKIIALKRKTSSTVQTRKVFLWYAEHPQQQFEKIQWVDGDIRDYFSLDDAIQNVEKVYHAAAHVSFLPREFQKTAKTNVEGTANIVNIALKKNIRLCHVSSIASLGSESAGIAVHENSERTNSETYSPYSLSKFYSETEVWRGIAEGLDAVIVNPSVIIGAWDWKNGSSQMFTAIANGLKFYTKGITGFVDVNDTVKAMIKLMDSDISGERFVLNSENISYQQLFQLIADVLQCKPPSIFIAPPVTGVLWRLDALKSRLPGCKPLLTKYTARSAHKKSSYDSNKIRHEKRIGGFNFTPVKQSISEIGKFFLQDKS